MPAPACSCTIAAVSDEKRTNGFDHPLTAAIYDQAEGSREDLDHYAAIVEELGAR